MNEEYINELLQELKQEWSYPDGFFVKARYGEMDSDGYGRVISILERMSAVLSGAQDEKTLDRKLVLGLWHIPWFLQVQDSRVYKKNKMSPEKHWATWCSKVHTLIWKIFGLDTEAYGRTEN